MLLIPEILLKTVSDYCVALQSLKVFIFDTNSILSIYHASFLCTQNHCIFRGLVRKGAKGASFEFLLISWNPFFKGFKKTVR